VWSQSRRRGGRRWPYRRCTLPQSLGLESEQQLSSLQDTCDAEDSSRKQSYLACDVSVLVVKHQVWRVGKISQLITEQGALCSTSRNTEQNLRQCITMCMLGHMWWVTAADEQCGCLPRHASMQPSMDCFIAQRLSTMRFAGKVCWKGPMWTQILMFAHWQGAPTKEGEVDQGHKGI